jgi:hypothetical protein
MNRRDFIRAAPIVPGAFFLAGCPKVGTVIGDTQIAVDAVSLAAPIIAAFVPGAAILIPWIELAAQGLQSVLSVASAPGATPLLIAQAIAKFLAGINPANFPAGTPQTIIDLINKIMTAITNLVSKYGTPAAIRNARSMPMPNLNHADHSAISAMRSKLDAAMGVLVTKP